VSTVANQIKDVRRRAGLSAPFEIVTYVLACVGRDRKSARQKVRDATAFYLEAMGATLMTSVYVPDKDVRALLARGGGQTLAKNLPEDWIDWLAIAGEPADAVAAIKAHFAAGATSVVLCIVPSEELPEQLELIGKEVLPHL
jgi:alkanesulfonate monooxygenase SsuD/methylene tetrahydromethanopterin reductase-like flavin-dependent oxidoreductase (luciferase family)